MIKTFTHNDVVRYVYNETTKKETAEIAIALQHDEELRSFYNECKQTINLVEMVMLEPSNSVLEKIYKLG